MHMHSLYAIVYTYTRMNNINEYIDIYSIAIVSYLSEPWEVFDIPVPGPLTVTKLVFEQFYFPPSKPT